MKLDSPPTILQQTCPIFHADRQIPHVHKVKRCFSPNPVPPTNTILNHKLAIRWHEIGLNGTQIRPKDTGRRILVGESDCPGAGPSSNVEHVLDEGRYWGEVEAGGEGEEPSLVLGVQSFLFPLKSGLGS